MGKRKKIETDILTVWYTQAHLTLRQIATLAGMSHVGVAKRLRSAGITAHDGVWVKLACNYCGKEFERPRCQAKRERSYCCEDHYFADLENPGYKPWRQGQRLARAIVSQYTRLDPDEIVHHEDGNCKNNDRKNLRVFANQSDHLKYHRSKDKPSPVWDGSLL
jgi:hypothetical protein